MKNIEPLAPWIRRFLLEYLVTDRNLARNTQRSYRDTLTMFLPFVAKKLRKSIDLLTVEDISIDCVREFLLELEKGRGCSISTRNQRLAAIHSLARFVGERNPELLVWFAEIHSIPFKKSAAPSVTYLEKQEIDALLNVPDRQTQQGLRDYALLLFLYNSGARASEVAQLTITDLNLGPPPSITLLGKGGKVRCCPLWPQTVSIIVPLIAGREPHEAIFLNRTKEPITRFGIRALVKRSAQEASRNLPSLSTKSVSTHTIRHTTAVHLLRSGVDINTIRAWLGHASLDTTHKYAEVDLEMKAKALAQCKIPSSAVVAATEHWSNNLELMAFLKSL